MICNDSLPMKLGKIIERMIEEINKVAKMNSTFLSRDQIILKIYPVSYHQSFILKGGLRARNLSFTPDNVSAGALAYV